MAWKPVRANAKLAWSTNHLPVALTARLPFGVGRADQTCGCRLVARWLRRDRRLQGTASTGREHGDSRPAPTGEPTEAARIIANGHCAAVAHTEGDHYHKRFVTRGRSTNA